MKTWAILGMFSAAGLQVLGQCPTADFSLPTDFCAGQQVSFNSAVQNAVQYTWDFCDGSIRNTPIVQTTQVIGQLSNPFDLEIINDNGNFFALVANLGSGAITKLSFGSSMENAPTVVDLGNFGLISGALGAGLWKEAGNWYGLVATNPGDVFLLSFGNSLDNLPTANKIPGISLPNHRHIKILKDGSNVVALIAGGSSGKISILDFGTTIQNVPTLTTLTVPNGGFLTGLDVYANCNTRFVVVSGYSSGIHVLSFPSNFISGFGSSARFAQSTPMGLSIINNENKFSLLVSSESEGLVRFDLGSDLMNAVPQKTIFGFFSSFNQTYGFQIIKSGSQYYGAGVNFSNSYLTVVKFPKNCGLSSSFANNLNPAITYSGNGTYSVSILAEGANGEQVVASKSLEVNYGGLLDFTTINQCANQSVNFIPSNVPNGTTATTWNFGDLQASALMAPPHVYSSAGSYTASLTIQNGSGCTKTISKVVDIFNEPIPSFSLPSGSTTCTNQIFSFKNTTVFDLGNTPTWAWSVDGISTSSLTDLTYSFPTQGDHAVSLRASIPGCSNTVTNTFTIQQVGILVDFQANQFCLGQSTIFVNTSSDLSGTFAWNFGDGNNSASVSPSHNFSAAGSYPVTLSVTNGAGCQNSKQISVAIHPNPSPDFYIDLPPFSCSGSVTQFHDATPPTSDGNIVHWSWDFNDGTGATSTQQNPQHTYMVAGTYQVSLTAKTNFGCEATVQQPIEIADSPLPDFSLSPACLNKGTTFKSLNAQGIASWQWTIGNSMYSIPEPIHTFTSPGTFQAMLVVVGYNGCEGLTTKNVVVNAQPALDFGASNVCAGQPTLFSGTMGGTDSPKTWAWDFNGSPGTGSPVSFSFPTSGAKTVKMTVNTQAGCDYSLTKNVVIAPTPEATFTTAPAFGAPPLVVQFTNTTQNASSFSWDFGFNSNTSTSTNPTFTYTEVGDYLVQLTAMNGAGCADTFTQIVNVMVPSYDLAIENLIIQQSGSSGSKIPIIIVKNNSNVSVASADVWITGSTGLRVKSNMTLSLLPGASQQFAIPMEVFTNEKFLCVELDVANDADVTNNMVCQNLVDGAVLVAPYPNPTTGVFWVEALLTQPGSGTLRIADGVGRTVFSETFKNLSEGMNRIEIDFSNQRPGLYLAIWNLNGKQTEFRFLLH